MAWLAADDANPASTTKEANSARLARYVFDLVSDHIRNNLQPVVTPELLCTLNRLAMLGLADRVGCWREVDVVIAGAAHRPPPHEEVPMLVDECCAYINDAHQNPLHPAAYALWRISWIHPFDDGNGRVSRALSYLVFCTRSGFMPPGRVMFAERVLQRRRAYQNLLAEADQAWRGSSKHGRKPKIALKSIESFIDRLIRAQVRDDAPKRPPKPTR